MKAASAVVLGISLCINAPVSIGNTGLVSSTARVPVIWSGAGDVKVYVSDIDFGPAADRSLRIPSKDVRAIASQAIGRWTTSRGAHLPKLDIRSDTGSFKMRLDSLTAHTILRYSIQSRAIFIVYDEKDVLKIQQTYGAENIRGVTGVTDWRSDGTGLGLGAAVITITPFGAENSSLLLETLTHEIGHALGLGHSLLSSNAELANGDYKRHITAMFPWSAVSPVRQNDEAWLAHLYRDKQNILSEHGLLRGIVRTVTGNPVSGVNLVAVQVDPEADSTDRNASPMARRFACFNGYSAVTGGYELPALPGRYRIIAESLPRVEELLPLPDFYNDDGAHLGPQIMQPDESRKRVTPSFGISGQPVNIILGKQSQQTVDVLEGQVTKADLRLTR